MFLPFALLTLAIVALWLGGDGLSWIRRYGWVALLLAAMSAAWTQGVLAPIGCGWIGCFALAAYGFCRSGTQRVLRVGAAIAMVVLAAGLISHQLPGFNNPRVISGLQLSPDAVPYRLHLNFDKTVVGLLLLAFCHPLIRSASEWRRMLALAAPIAVGVIVLVLIFSLAAGHVRFDPKFPREAWLWMWVNLSFTCLAEEAFFRGFVQAQLAKAWASLAGGPWLALSVAALLFGLAHYAGGAVYVALATIAGAGYGWAYLRTGRIEASILTHFALNAVHFFGFTYPALRPGS